MRRALVVSMLCGSIAMMASVLPASGSPSTGQEEPGYGRLLATKVVSERAAARIRYRDERRQVTDLFVKEQGVITRYTYPLGYFDTVSSVLLPTGRQVDVSPARATGGSEPDRRNLKEIFQKCFEYNPIDYHGFHCYRAYKPSVRDGNRSYNYRVFFWKGSGNARNRRDLERMALGLVLKSDTRAHATAQMTGEFQPHETHPSDCRNVNLTLNLAYKGVGASVGTSFKRCDTYFGPVPDNYGLKRFIFHWKGEKPGDVVVGMAGGAEFKFIPNKGYAARRVHNYRSDL